MKNIINILPLLLLLLHGCGNGSNDTKVNHQTTMPKPLFSSGFEDGTYIDSEVSESYKDYTYIKGKDKETGFSWPINIFGSNQSALHHIDDDGLQAVSANLVSVIGHKNKTTKVLHLKQNYAAGLSTQYPYGIYDIKEGPKDVYVSYWMKIDGNMIGKPNTWRSLFEYKTKNYDNNGGGFGLEAYVYTDLNGKPSWHLQGGKNSEHPLWSCDTLTPTAECKNKEIPVITNQWFHTEYYWHWSEGDDGFIQWKINGEVVGEHHGATTLNSDALNFILLTQISGNSNPKEQWIDDIEIWSGLPK